MWPLQRKNIHKKITLWLKIAGFCLFFHFVILFWIFCVYRENKFMYAFSIDKKIDYSCPILFVPIGISTSLKPIQKTVAASAQKTIQPPSSSPQKKTIVACVKAEVKKQEIKPAIIQTPQIAIPEKIEHKSTIKKPQDLPNPISEKKKNESAPQQPSPPLAKHAPKNRQQEIKQNAHLSNNYREVEALRRGAQLQKELVAHWHPPVGILPDCICDISFFVTKQGKIENLKTIKSSGIIMFDISARQALLAMKMPTWTYGKPLIISFKQ